MKKRIKAFTPKMQEFNPKKIKWTLIATDEEGKEVKTELSTEALENKNQLDGIVKQSLNALKK